MFLKGSSGSQEVTLSIFLSIYHGIKLCLVSTGCKFSTETNPLEASSH